MTDNWDIDDRSNVHHCPNSVDGYEDLLRNPREMLDSSTIIILANTFGEEHKLFVYVDAYISG